MIQTIKDFDEQIQSAQRLYVFEEFFLKKEKRIKTKTTVLENAVDIQVNK